MKNDAPRKVISSFADIPTKSEFVEVQVPEWGTEDEPAVVLMRHISGSERRRFTSQGELGILGQMNDREREVELKRWKEWFDTGKREREMLKMCYVKEDGSPLFSDEDARRLADQGDSRPFLRLVARAEEENILTVAAEQEFRKNA